MSAEAVDQPAVIEDLLERVSTPLADNIAAALSEASLTVLEIDRLTSEGAKSGACAQADERLGAEQESFIRVVSGYAGGEKEEPVRSHAESIRLHCVARYAGQRLLGEISDGYYADDPDSYRSVIQSGFRLPVDKVIGVAESLLEQYVANAPANAKDRDDLDDRHLAIADAFLYLGSNMPDQAASEQIQARKAEMVIAMLKRISERNEPGKYAALDLIRPVEEPEPNGQRRGGGKMVLPIAILGATIVTSPILFAGRASAETAIVTQSYQTSQNSDGTGGNVIVIPHSGPTAIPSNQTSVGVTDSLANTARTPDGSIVIKLSGTPTRTGGQAPAPTTPSSNPNKSDDFKLDSRDATSIYQSLIAEFPPANGQPTLIDTLASQNFDIYAGRMAADAKPTDSDGLRKLMIDNTVLAYMQAGAEHPILLAPDGQKHTDPHAISAALMKLITGDPANKDLLAKAQQVTTQLSQYKENGRGYFDGWTREQIATYAILQARLDTDFPAPPPAASPTETTPTPESADYAARVDQGRIALIQHGGKWPGKPEDLLALVKTTTAKYNHPVITTDVVLAQEWAESAFNPDAVSRSGAVGISQFMPGTAQTWVHGSSRDPAAAIDAQVRYMIYIYDHYVKDNTNIPANKKLDMAFAGYNSGPNNINKVGLGMLQGGRFQEATTYVSNIRAGVKYIYAHTPADPTMGQKILTTAKQFDGIYYDYGGGVHNHDQSTKFTNSCPAAILKNAAGKSTKADPGPCAPDCSGLVGAAVQMITGHDPGGWTVQSMEDDWRDWTPISWSQARPGDVAIRNNSNGYGEHVELITSDKVTGNTVTTYGAHQTGTKVSSGGSSSLGYWNAGAWRYIGPSK